MLTIAVPMASGSAFFPQETYKFPKMFQEIHGRPMIQVVIENLLTIKGEKKFVFIINDSDAKRYRLDNILRMLTGENCEIVLQHAPTKGAACSLLLGIHHLNGDGPLLVSNADQIIEHDFNKIFSHFEERNIDGGVVCFNSVHPQWSYARVSDDDSLIETAEKTPISKNAIAGLYYFKRSKDFVDSAMKSIVKDRNHDGKYYTSMVLNELVLCGKRLTIYNIESNEYISFYSPERIKEYEQRKGNA